jgi:hypothetical protein
MTAIPGTISLDELANDLDLGNEQHREIFGARMDRHAAALDFNQHGRTIRLCTGTPRGEHITAEVLDAAEEIVRTGGRGSLLLARALPRYYAAARRLDTAVKALAAAESAAQVAA